MTEDIPVVAGIIRYTGTLGIEHPLVVAGAVAEKHTGVIKHVVAWGAVTAIITLCSTLH